LIRPSANPAALRREFAPDGRGPLIALLPGSRPGEALRHLPALLDAAERLQTQRRARFILSLPEGFQSRADLKSFRERFSRLTIQVLEGRTWDVLACADLALAASGTVTIEAALLGAPMITFYRVNKMSWLIGKLLVRVPFYSMVNLIAGRRVVPELIQNQMTGERLAAEAGQLLDDENGRARMRADLATVARRLAADADPLETAASVVEMFLKEEMAHVS
jgi:lipid-A-disaccharide synthase